MKRILFIIALLPIISGMVSAQFEEGVVEMSLSGTLGSQKSSVSSSGYSSSSEYYSYFFLSTSVGYYITNGLSIEPQLGIMVFEDEDPAQSLLLNLSFTKRLTNTSVALFARIGYGLSNGISFPAMGGVTLRLTDSWDVKIFNIGGGLKILVAENVALRTEFSYRSESYSISETDFTYSNIGLLIGFSILL